MTEGTKEQGREVGRMSPRASPPATTLRGRWLLLARVAWLAMALLAVGLFVVALPVHYGQIVTLSDLPEGIDPTVLRANLAEAGLSVGFYATYHLAVAIGFAAACVALAAVIFWRRSDERMALFVALLLVLLGTTLWGIIQSLAAVHPAGGVAFRMLDSLSNLSLFVFFYLFPDGRFVPRWTRWLAAAILAFVALSFLFPDSPLNPDNFPLPVFIVFVLGLLLTGVYAQIYRYRRVSGPVERQQTKWVILSFAAALCGFLVVLFFGEVLFSLAEPGTVGEMVASTVLTLFMFLIPLSIGVSILRYRLFDIDVLINRTLVYGSLTVSLVLAYIGSVVALQGAFRALTGQGSQLAVVASTLAVAALFNPVRRRIQSFIDRRFYRRKYDAVKTLETFSAKLRDETDLDALNNELVSVVRETIQPAHVSLWLRPDTAPKGEQAE